MKNSRLTTALFLVIFGAVIAVLGMDIDARASASIRIGVLAHKGTDTCRKMWQPTMDYLDMALPGHQFDLAPLKFDEIESAVKNKSIDFLICNPAIYVDIGTVRTDTIERMAADGEIRMDAIRVISVDVVSGPRSTFPYLHSTRLYPEWPFAKLSDTTEDLSREVTVALLTMPADSPAAMAAQSGGWGVCQDYTSVHDCLRELRLPPYEHYGQMSWPDMWRQYWPWLIAIASLIIALLGALLQLRGRNLALVRVSSQNRLLLTSAGEGICGIDINGITTFVNPAANKMLGYTSEELLGKNLHTLTHHTKPDGLTYPVHECPIYMACNDGAVHQGSDEFFYRKDGSAIPISYSSRPVVDERRIHGAVICFQDITKRKRDEEELKQYRDHLEQTVRERTGDLHTMNEQLLLEIAEHKQTEEQIGVLNKELQGSLQELIEAKALEEAAKHAKSEFLSNISHELTTPLNHIIGFSQVLLTKNFGNLNEKQQGYVETIINSGERLHETLKNIVSFVRMDVSNPDMEWEDFLLKDIIDSSLSAFRKVAIDRHFTLTCDMGTEAGRMIRADRGKLAQVFQNIISNAMKFSRDGGRITLSVCYRKGSKKSGKDDFIEVTVEDTGIGIKEEDVPRLFRPFEQIEAPLTKQYAGVGIGLVLASKLIEAHGGAIRLESDYGKGSRFIFTIPVKDGYEKGSKGSQI